jgi:hypothetical protein
MSESTDDLARRSEEHRANIAHLVDELRSHVTPGEIVNQVVGPDAGAALMRLANAQIRKQIRRNPIPVAIIGAGLAWLLLADALHRRRQIPLHDGLDYEDYSETSARRRLWILGGATRVVRRLSEPAAKSKPVVSGAEQEVLTDGKQPLGRQQPRGKELSSGG